MSDWRYVRLTGEPGAEGETSPRLEVTAVSPAVITIDRRTTNYPTVELDLVAHHWPEGQEYIVTLNGTEVYPNEDEERATDSANFIHEYESFPSGKYVTFHVSCSNQSVDFDVDVPVDDVTQTQKDFGLSSTLPQGTVLNGDVFIPTADIELEDETVIHAYQPCMYDGTTWVELPGSDGTQLVVKHLGEITAITQGSDIPSTAVVYTAIVNSLFAQNVVTENLTVGESSTLLGSINTKVIETIPGDDSEVYNIVPSSELPPYFDFDFEAASDGMNLGGSGRYGKWELDYTNETIHTIATWHVNGLLLPYSDAQQQFYGPGGRAGTSVTSATKQFPSSYYSSPVTARVGGTYGWGGEMEGHFPITNVELTIKNYNGLLTTLTRGNPKTKWYVQVTRGGVFYGIIAEGTFARQTDTEKQQTVTVNITDGIFYPDDVIEVILEPTDTTYIAGVNKRGSVTAKGSIVGWPEWSNFTHIPLVKGTLIAMDFNPAEEKPSSASWLYFPFRSSTYTPDSYLYQVREYSGNTLIATYGPVWQWSVKELTEGYPQSADYSHVTKIDCEILAYDEEDPYEWSYMGPPIYNGRVFWNSNGLYILDSEGEPVAQILKGRWYKSWEVSFTWQGEEDICHLKTPTPFEDDPLKSIGTYTDHWSEAWIDTIHGSVEGTITDARDAEYAQKIGKFGHTSQIGSASQPVYVNSNGVVTAGNSIPDVSGLATKTELTTHTGNTTVHVTSEDKTTWNGKYSKPSTGIPKTDLASAVQTSLGKADTALQSADITGKEDKSNKVTSWSSTTTDAHYPSEKLVKSALDAKAPNDEYQTHVANTFIHTTTNEKNTWNGKYTKPSEGIPKSHLVSSVQTSLGKADTALQASDITGKEDKSNKVTSWSSTTTDAHYPSEKLVKTGLDGKVNTGDFNTHTANTSIHTTTNEKNSWYAKYDKPSTGIPKTDLASGVQSSLGLADSAVQPADLADASVAYADESGWATGATTANTANAVAWGNVTGKPTFGTASGKDVPASGNASTSQVVMGNDTRLTDSRTPTAHTHDDRYYTESEMDTKLSGKANSTHTHTKSQITDFPTLGTASSKDIPSSGNASTTQVVMGNDTRLTDARTPTAHTHDDRYYTESEVDTKLSGKANSTHTHVKADITDFSHTHDDRYYTESEVDTKLSNKMDKEDVDFTSTYSSKNFLRNIKGNNIEVDNTTSKTRVEVGCNSSSNPFSVEQYKIYSGTTKSKQELVEIVPSEIRSYRQESDSASALLKRTWRIYNKSYSGTYKGCYDGHLESVDNIDDITWMSSTDVLNYLNGN